MLEENEKHTHATLIIIKLTAWKTDLLEKVIFIYLFGHATTHGSQGEATGSISRDFM
jgi:hypothetical protein